MSSLSPPENRKARSSASPIDDQPAGAGVDDVVDPLAQRGPGRDHLERLDEPGLLARLELLFELFPGTWRHTDPILPGFPVIFARRRRDF